MAQITYENKVKINDNSNIPAVNKGRDVDWNEIKSVVNENDDNVGDLSLLNTINKSSIVSAINEIVDKSVFSTVEKIIGKWIDGKLIYRKVVNFGALPNTSEKNVPHNISNFNFATKIDGIAYNSDGRTFPLPAVSFGISSGNITPSIYVFADRTNITIGTGVDRSAYNGYVIIEYTKTTD